jgi:uncharacterized protein (TIGR03435 family)
MNLLVDHLWQSTLFAAIAGLLTLALRKNRARVRHWVWFTASCKFLIPLSLLTGLGSQVQWRMTPAPAKVSIVMDYVSQPFKSATPTVAKPAQRSLLPAILFGLWACGFLSVTGSWWHRWRRIRAAVHGWGGPPGLRPMPSSAFGLITTAGPGGRARTRVPTPHNGLAIAVHVISSPALMEPGVFGVFRPVLLLPDGIFDRLSPAQFRTVIEHELCHVRHRDNLIAAIHMLVEAAFWFHPPVWWIGKRVMEEREQACDEEVLDRIGEPRVSAEAILNVCKLYVESPLTCVTGVAGANLKKRIEGILSNRISFPVTFRRKVALATAGIAALLGPVAIGVVGAPAIVVQPQTAQRAASPKFEVASIHAGCAVRASGDGAISDPGRMILCVPLRTFIRDAYVFNQDGQHHPGYGPHTVPMEGGPAWVYSDTYTINAKAEKPAAYEMLHGPMLQMLLEDRFKLKLHRESRIGPAYALVVAKGGPKLQKSREGSCVPFDIANPAPVRDQVPCGPEPPRILASGPNFVSLIRGLTLDEFSAFLFSAMLDRPVLNQTGITGRFDFRLEYTPDQTHP